MQTAIEPVNSDRYNDVIRNVTVLTMIRHLARKKIDFSSAALVSELATLAEFPFITARALMAGGLAAGVEMSGGKLALENLPSVDLPLLTYMESLAPDDDRVQLVEILGSDGDKVVVSDGPMGLVRMTLAKLKDVWTGVVFTAQGSARSDSSSELEDYRSRVAVLPDLLSPAECAELLEYCERGAFRRSRVSNDDPRLNGGAGIISQKVRNSTSVTLESREHPCLARLYAAVADMEGVDQRDVEQIQCVRYKRGQRFRSHFDAASGIPRKTTYLLYLNDDFVGGSTHFPMLDLDIVPKTGSCLRFPSCDDAGRVYWQSEHGGQPVSNGTKYALNIWVHLPSGRD